MTLGPDNLELRFAHSEYGLSARRLWEHTELGQANVFARAIKSWPGLNDAAAFIDVVWVGGINFALTCFTLAELKTGNFPLGTAEVDQSISPELAEAGSAVAFVRMVGMHLDHCSHRKALRNQNQQFLPGAKASDVFGVPHFFSTLQRSLMQTGVAKAKSDQWLGTIENFRKKGLRSEELERSNLVPELAALDDSGERATAEQVMAMCDFSSLRLSVIPVVKAAQRQLRFASAPSRVLKRTMKLPKAQAGQTRTVGGYDPVLGYRLELVEHEALWGPERHWQAVTHDGQVISNDNRRNLLFTKESAAALADAHAKQHFPKRVALGQWGHIAWTGGEEYREWLVTLPYFPGSYFSSHFSVRNVLAHVRCDIREGVEGERVLLLQEVQSDWAQNARRSVGAGLMAQDDEELPPFLKEWPSLAIKLMLLHAAHQGLDAVAWTRGAHQVFRYRGLGATGLTELYDRTLPREVNRTMKRFGAVCEMLGVFVPTNFSIRQSEVGYDVYTAENELLGTAPTLEDARLFVPDGGHELLYEVHGIRMPVATRKEILNRGFPAWG